MADIICTDILDVHWTQAPTALELPATEVHICRFFMPQTISVSNELPEGWREKVRDTTTALLAKYSGVPPEKISIGRTPNNKPVLLSPAERQLHFNISHSGRWLAVALAQKAIGIDIEKIQQPFSLHAVMQDYFSSAERDFVTQSQNPLSSFFKIWTRKEALIKAMDHAIDEDIRHLRCLNGINTVDTALSGTKIDWNIASLEMDNHHQLSYAYPVGINMVRHFEQEPIRL